MRELFAKLRLPRLSDQGGWVMMDAIWSSVVVLLAFSATFMALENGTKTATRDIAKTAAYDVAQDELSMMRDLGKKDLNNGLLALENTATPPSSPSKTVTLNGTQYRIWYRAYYVTGLGNNSTDACGGTYSSNGDGTAKFIYIKVTVDWDGRSPNSPMPTLDEYFAPEGGDTNAATGTLRVYLLRPPFDYPWTGVDVTLDDTGVGMSFSAQTRTTGSGGCVLFTGLPRGAFDIRVATTKYDMYVNNPGGGQLIVPINLPDRAAISKDIRMNGAIVVAPQYWTNKGTGAPADDLQVTPTTSTTVGPPTYLGTTATGNWIARSDQILRAQGTNFTPLPGTAYLPHLWLPSYAQNYMYPEPTGYDVFAGPCDVNQPPAAVPVRHFPDSASNPSWVPGLTYQEGGVAPRFYLPQLRSRIYIGNPTPARELLRDMQIKDGAPGRARVLVRLTGRAGATAASPSASCGTPTRNALFNTWQRMKGTMIQPFGSTSTVSTPAWRQTLADDAEVLPSGKYDICMQAYVSYSDRVRTNTWFPATYSSWTARNEYRYRLFTGVNISSSTDISWDPIDDSYTTTDCSGGASWSP